MNDETRKAFEQASAFQKIWMESFSKMAQAVFTVTPEAMPPDVLRQLRGSIFQALAKSWEEFMRSPQFLEAMRQLMDNAMSFRKLSNDVLTRLHHETQGTARTDIDTVMLTVRHLEGRVIDRIDELAEQVGELRQRFNGGGGTPKAARTGRPARTKSRRPARAKGRPAAGRRAKRVGRAGRKAAASGGAGAGKA